MRRRRLNEAAVRRLVRRFLRESTENGGLVGEVQELFQGNAFLRNTVASESNLIEGTKYVAFLSDSTEDHIRVRHSDPSKPGSTIDPSVDVKDVIGKLLELPPTESNGGRVKWLGVDVGMQVGGMGVALATESEVEGMQDYQMPDGKRETVKVAPGRRATTSQASLIAGSVGTLADGRELLSVITVFPGGSWVDGVEIPADRNDFAAKGLYFVVEGAKGAGGSAITERWQRLAGLVR